MNDNTTDTLTLDLADDRGMGLAMLVTFTAAALIVTGAVAMLALIGTWWVLGLAFAIHLLMTAAVGYVSFTALDQGMLMRTDTVRPERQEVPLEALTRSRPPSAGHLAA